MTDTECPICLDPLDVEHGFARTGCCKTDVCFNCFVNWRANNDTCPVCRTGVPTLPFRERVELVRIQPPSTIQSTNAVAYRQREGQRIAGYIFSTITLIVVVTTVVTNQCGG